MIERRIKELSIAFEALSRINDPDAANCIVGVSELLKSAIEQATKESHPLHTTNADNYDDIPL